MSFLLQKYLYLFFRMS